MDFGPWGRPELLPNFVEQTSCDDLILLDAVGWDVDYSGQASPDTGGQAAMAIEELEDRRGAAAASTVITIRDH